MRSQIGERRLEAPLRYALAVNPPRTVPASLNGFALWNAIVLVLMLFAYGYPIGQFFVLKVLGASLRSDAIVNDCGRCAVMARDQGSFSIDNPWPKIGWGMTAGVIVVAVVIGFGVLSRYQQNGSNLDLWNAICRGLGVTSDSASASEPRPTLHTPTRIAWTSDTLALIGAGDPGHGAFVALNCAACHGQGGVSTSTLIPTLAGMDAAVIYKQLDDYRSGNRLWGVMGAMAKSLSPQDSADVAAYFAAQRDGLPAIGSNRMPEWVAA